MSNTDNIYNILNNFNKIAKDAPAPVAATPKAKTKLQESMEQVVNEKYMGFKKTVAAIKKGGSAEDPEAVAAAIGRKKYGKEKFQKAAAAGKKLGEGQNESALQAYIGNKKYTKKGMKELQDAGRDGADEEEKGRIKDKYLTKEDHGPENPEAPVNYGEYDREGDMAKDDLYTIDSAAEELYSILQADENLPEWVQSKITKAVDYIDTARDYMKAQSYGQGVTEGSGDPQIPIGMKTQYGTVVSVDGDKVTVRASNGELTTVNIQDIDQAVAEGYDPVESDFKSWVDITRKETMRDGKTNGANSVEIMARYGGDDMTDIIRNILAYVKQNRQELGREVSEETGRTVKDCIIDIRNEFPQEYQAAQQPQGMAEGSSENKYSNLSNRGVNRGINRAGDDFNRMMDLDQVESPHYKTQHQQDTKQRLKTKPMAGPKGVLPEQGVAEATGSSIERILAAHPEAVENFKQGGDLDYDLESDLWEYYFNNGEIRNYDADASEFISQRLADELGLSEGLDANQKRVGQLGPTEKVKNNNIGKLVGANENFINTVDQAVVSEEDEMAESILSAIRKVGKKAFDKVAPVVKKVSNIISPDDDKLIRDLDNDVHGGKVPNRYNSDAESAKKYPADSWKVKEDESSDELARILTIMNHRR